MAEIQIKDAKLVSVMSEYDLCDIFRVHNPEMKCYAWRRKTPFKQHRLDYFLISDQLQDQIDHSFNTIRPLNFTTEGMWDKT